MSPSCIKHCLVLNILHRVDWPRMSTPRRRRGQCGTWVWTTTLPCSQVHMTVSGCERSSREFTEGLPVDKIVSVQSIPNRRRVVGFLLYFICRRLYRYPELTQKLHAWIVSYVSESSVFLLDGEETVLPYGRSPYIQPKKVCHLVTSDGSEFQVI
jgi:hypothetical protein